MKTRKTGKQVRSTPFGTANPEKARSERGTAFRCTPDLDRGGPRAERQQGRAGMHAPRAHHASRATAPPNATEPRQRPTRSEPGGRYPR
jgi:hypothetical protein